jgi:hypothetical protein
MLVRALQDLIWREQNSAIGLFEAAPWRPLFVGCTDEWGVLS